MRRRMAWRERRAEKGKRRGGEQSLAEDER